MTPLSFKKAFGFTELTEIINHKALIHIINNWDSYKNEILKEDWWDVNYKPKTILSKYINLYMNNNKKINIKYKKGIKYETKMGRWFCNASIGIQSMPRKIRHTLCKDLWIDLDFKNCHPSILKQICDKHNIECPYLSEYIADRTTFLNKIVNARKCSIEDAKYTVLKALNGNKNKYNIPEWDNIISEFSRIADIIASYPCYQKLKEECQSFKDENVNARVMNRVLCAIENECLECLFNYLYNKGMLNVSINDTINIVCSLIFDGLQIPDNSKNREFLTIDNLKLITEHIQGKTGYKLEIAIKEFDECLTLPENYDDELISEEHIIDNGNDTKASRIIIEKYGHLYIKCEKSRYIKHNNIWTNDMNIIKDIIFKHIQETDIKYLLNDEGKTKSYSTSLKNIKACYELVLVNGFKEDNNFIKNIQKNSKNYLPFKNGFYSFIDKKLYNYDELPNINFTQQIYRDFPTFNKDNQDELLTRIINPIFPNEEERHYFFHSISRALAGYFTDKKWSAGVGARNCGKTVITKTLTGSFGCYVKSFDAKCLISNKFGNPDVARALSWVVDVKDARLIISNEIGTDSEDIKLNGNFLKTLASGGDEMIGRQIYEKSLTFTPQFTVLLCCNKLYEISPIDAMENLEQFNFKSKFVNEDELLEGITYLKLKDDGVKDLIIEDRILDAFTLYVLEAFEEKRRNTPDVVKVSTEIARGDITLTKEQFILQNFRDSTNDDEKLHTEMIANILKDNGYKLSPVDVGRIFNQMGIGKYNKHCNINRVRKAGYENIKFIGEVNEVDE
jgi:hypothetical protein